MLKKYIEVYMRKMQSIKDIKNILSEYMPKKIDKDVNKFSDAISMDIYFGNLLYGEKDENFSKLEKHVNTFVSIEEVDKEEKQISYKFIRPGDNFNKHKNIDESRKVVITALNTYRMLYNNLLISILIEFENVISKLFKKIVTLYPDAYLNDVSISFSEIVKAENIEDLRNKKIKDTVDNIMRQSIFEWIKILEKNHKKKITFENEYTKKFIEAYFRRNIIVHNDAKINNDYINGMKKIGVDIPTTDIGKSLICTEEYIDYIIDASNYLLIYILNNCIDLIEKNNPNKFVDYILDLGFNKIKSEEYIFAREIIGLVKEHKFADQQTKIYALINYWQTYKWDNSYEEIREEVEKFDSSAYDTLIKLAIYALKDDYFEIEKILDKEFKDEWQNEELANCLEDFPIFKKVREQKFYGDIVEKYSDVFKTKLASLREENEEIIQNNIKTSFENRFKISLTINQDEYYENVVEDEMILLEDN